MSSFVELGIKHKKFDDTLIASIRLNIKDREELQATFRKLTQKIPTEYIIGPGFCIYHFISSVKEGFDVEAGFPVSQTITTNEIKTRVLSKMEVLSFLHRGPVDKLSESVRKLYRTASNHGLISDEFSREIYLDSNNPQGNEIEVQMVIHDWSKLFSTNLTRVLGGKKSQKVMDDSENLSIESSLNERFLWVKGVMEKLNNLTTEDQKYDIVSSCAHVFAKEPIMKARRVYENIVTQTNDSIKAVDAVLDFMEKDPAWPQRPVRTGRIIYSTKLPRDPESYEKATDKKEKRKAYCFCPIVRDRLEDEMPITFCYCGAGWFRQQWELIFNKPVKVDLIESVLQGNDVCKFAIHLPDDY